MCSSAASTGVTQGLVMVSGEAHKCNIYISATIISVISLATTWLQLIRLAKTLQACLESFAKGGKQHFERCTGAKKTTKQTKTKKYILTNKTCTHIK